MLINFLHKFRIKRYFKIFFFIILLGTISIKIVNAATTSTGGNAISGGNISVIQQQNFVNALKDPGMNLDSFIAGKELVNIPQAGMVSILMRTLTANMWGLYDEKGNPINLGALGPMEQIIGTFYKQQPISSVAYVNYLTSNLSLVKPAYAITGIQFLDPVLNLWKRMRDIAYIFFVIIFIAIGFMVMFRTKLNPQTVVTVQDSLPRIVVGLLLVTFSYAIAGMIVDLVYLGNELLYNIFHTDPIVNMVTASTWNIKTLFDQWGSLQTPVKVQFGPWVVGGACTGIICRIGASLATGIPSLLNGSISDLVDFILALVVITTIFKIFLGLLTKYVSIFIYTIFSPLAFLWGSLPGQEDTGSKLIKGLISAAITFPAVYLLMTLALYFMNEVSTLQPLPPFDLGITGPGRASATITTYQGLVALGFLMAAASAPQAIDDILTVKGVAGAEAAGGLAGALRKLPIIGSFLG